MLQGQIAEHFRHKALLPEVMFFFDRGRSYSVAPFGLVLRPIHQPMLRSAHSRAFLRMSARTLHNCKLVQLSNHAPLRPFGYHSIHRNPAPIMSASVARCLARSHNHTKDVGVRLIARCFMADSRPEASENNSGNNSSEKKTLWQTLHSISLKDMWHRCAGVHGERIAWGTRLGGAEQMRARVSQRAACSPILRVDRK